MAVTARGLIPLIGIVSQTLSHEPPMRYPVTSSVYSITDYISSPFPCGIPLASVRAFLRILLCARIGRSLAKASPGSLLDWGI